MRKRVIKLIQRYDIIAYLVITFGVAWLFYIPAALLITGHPERISWLVFFQTPGAAAPLIAAIIIRYARGGKTMVKSGWMQYRLKQPAWSYVVAVSLLPLIALASVLITGKVGDGLGQIIQTAGFATVALMPLLLLTQLPGSPLLEEYGWRGYLLPRLQTRINAFWAAAVIGLLWGAHHIPVALAVNGSIVDAVLGAIAPSILLAWIYNSTRGGMAPVILLHASLNLSMLYIAPAGYVFYGLTGAASLVVVVIYGYKNLSQHQRVSMK